MSILDIRDLEVRYHAHGGGRVTAVAGANLSVEAGQIVALVGESGCGKSSLGKAAVGLIKPVGGSVTFNGEPVLPLGQGARPAAQRKLLMVFQDPYSSLNPRRTIGDQIGEGLRVARAAGLAPLTAEDYLDRVGLPANAAQRYPHQFSGGQRQRIAIARALAAQPSCIVADEPISALDASAQASVANLLRNIVREFGVALLFISHDLAIVRKIADVTTVMYLGKIVESGPSRTIWKQPRHPYTRALINAIPRPDGLGSIPADLPGDVPNPSAPPSGCRFHPRCPSALDICRSVEPERLSEGEGTTVACHVATRALGLGTPA